MSKFYLNADGDLLNLHQVVKFTNLASGTLSATTSDQREHRIAIFNGREKSAYAANFLITFMNMTPEDFRSTRREVLSDEDVVSFQELRNAVQRAFGSE